MYISVRLRDDRWEPNTIIEVEKEWTYMDVEEAIEAQLGQELSSCDWEIADDSFYSFLRGESDIDYILDLAKAYYEIGDGEYDAFLDYIWDNQVSPGNVYHAIEGFRENV